MRRHLLLLAALAAVLLSVSGCALGALARPPATVTVTASPAPASAATAAPATSGSTIQMIVASSEKSIASITYSDSGSSSSTTGQPAPWTFSYQLNPGYSFPSVTASLTDANSGSWVACQIRRDNQIIAQQWGQGAYASSSCSVRAQ